MGMHTEREERKKRAGRKKRKKEDKRAGRKKSGKKERKRPEKRVSWVELHRWNHRRGITSVELENPDCPGARPSYGTASTASAHQRPVKRPRIAYRPCSGIRTHSGPHRRLQAHTEPRESRAQRSGPSSACRSVTTRPRLRHAERDTPTFKNVMQVTLRRYIALFARLFRQFRYIRAWPCSLTRLVLPYRFTSSAHDVTDRHQPKE